MKQTTCKFFALIFAVTTLNLARAQDGGEIQISRNIQELGMTKPIPVAMDGFTGEAAQVLKFDLYVQGFSFVTPDAAQYLIHGSDAGNVIGTVTDAIGHKVVLSRSYSGASLRRQAHYFANDIVQAVLNLKGIGLDKIAFKSQSPNGGEGEIYVSDFDGYGTRQVTSDSAIVAKPAWVPERLALYYTSYARDNPDIFFHNLSTGQRRVFAGYPGLNTSAAVSQDGRVAMILSQAGRPNVWVCNADGSGLKRLTTGIEDSSPCWSPDGQWICFATKKRERRMLAKIPSGGGEIQYLNTSGVSSPTEPDWSPDGKWIAFTRQAGGGEFDICVMPADGTMGPTVLVEGQNPSWSPNSRTLIFNRGPAGHQKLSVLDVFTKQYKDCHRMMTLGSDSQPAWAR